MAALRIFARVDIAAILNPGRSLSHAATRCRAIAPVVAQIQSKRWGSYRASPRYTKPEDYTDYEITNDPNEWKYVERLLPYKMVPKPSTNVNLPSGWKPPRASPTDYPYFIQRTKNYMVPVYLSITYRGMRKITIVKKIEGDIWALEHDLRTYLEECGPRRVVPTQIHEFACLIKFKGDHVSRIKEWMDMKGF